MEQAPGSPGRRQSSPVSVSLEPMPPATQTPKTPDETMNTTGKIEESQAAAQTKLQEACGVHLSDAGFPPSPEDGDRTEAVRECGDPRQINLNETPPTRRLPLRFTHLATSTPRGMPAVPWKDRRLWVRSLKRGYIGGTRHRQNQPLSIPISPGRAGKEALALACALFFSSPLSSVDRAPQTKHPEIWYRCAPRSLCRMMQSRMAYRRR